ncbi:hypothetical protein [Lysobacter silvisoli]|uniref:hypothetical protein n=1 Tax=Lysobacter silvisoli TaxID=2293254 RepID=UPI0011C02266|nr:hypothetical protein [Lysobacter silvisoli]
MVIRVDDAAGDKTGYVAIGAAAMLSAFGWFAVDRWLPAGGDGSAVIVAILRTLFTLLPAMAGFMIANRRQRKTHRAIAAKLENLRGSMVELQRIRGIEHELHTIDRLAKVAREAVKNTASSAKELFSAIEVVDDPRVKERLVERYRSHTNNVVTVLSAVSEQMEESGRSIHRELSAEDAVHILERERNNANRGLDYAREIMEQRGIADGVKKLIFAAEQASLQLELSSLKAIAHDEESQNG